MKKRYFALVTAFLTVLMISGCTQTKTEISLTNSNTESSISVSSEEEQSKEESEEGSSEISVVSEDSQQKKYSEFSEPIFLSDDPFEYTKYLGQWEDLDGSLCSVEITTKDDKNFDIVISDNNNGTRTEYTLTGVYEQASGGIHYTGSMKQTGGAFNNSAVNCEGYLRRGQSGYLHWENLTEYYGNGFVFRRLDT